MGFLDGNSYNCNSTRKPLFIDPKYIAEHEQKKQIFQLITSGVNSIFSGLGSNSSQGFASGNLDLDLGFDSEAQKKNRGILKEINGIMKSDFLPEDKSNKIVKLLQDYYNSGNTTNRSLNKLVTQYKDKLET